MNLRHAIKKAMTSGAVLHIKFSLIENDIKTGEQVSFARYYDSRQIAFGQQLLNVYSWDNNGRRKNFRWRNFERTEELEQEMVQRFLTD